jgi:polar amino acid transport system ATP-binding protein
MFANPIVSVEHISKTFRSAHGRSAHRALDDISLTIQKGEVLVIIGPSGSGKSTLLRTLNALESFDSGRIVVDGVSLTDRSTDLNHLRAEIGMVFQNFNLFQHKTAIENVVLPQIVVRKRSRSEALSRAQSLLEKVGIADRANHYPSQLSGGQQQRVAIARAIVSDPGLLVCDEPTGDLDRHSAEEVLGLLRQLNREHGKTIVMVTHDPKAAEYADHTLHLDKGTLVEQVTA